MILYQSVILFVLIIITNGKKKNYQRNIEIDTHGEKNPSLTYDNYCEEHFPRMKPTVQCFPEDNAIYPSQYSTTFLVTFIPVLLTEPAIVISTPEWLKSISSISRYHLPFPFHFQTIKGSFGRRARVKLTLFGTFFTSSLLVILSPLNLIVASIIQFVHTHKSNFYTTITSTYLIPLKKKKRKKSTNKLDNSPPIDTTCNSSQNVGMQTKPFNMKNMRSARKRKDCPVTSFEKTHDYSHEPVKHHKDKRSARITKNLPNKKLDETHDSSYEKTNQKLRSKSYRDGHTCAQQYKRKKKKKSVKTKKHHAKVLNRTHNSYNNNCALTKGYGNVVQCSQVSK